MRVTFFSFITISVINISNIHGRWISCQCQAVLVLAYQGDSAFYQSVTQLKKFLKSERVEKELIARVMDYYQNLWLRLVENNEHIAMS